MLRIKRLRFRAWHRGTREADYLIGGFFDRYHQDWNDTDIGWIERLLDEEDVDILAWAMQTSAVPLHYHGPMMQAMQRLDYIEIP
jgi:antitoxin CptB